MSMTAAMRYRERSESVYAFPVDYEIRREAYRDDGYYTVRWSPIAKADKYAIGRSVPAMGGIAEIYYMDEKGKLNLFCLQRSWYGGVRAMIRERCDPEIEEDEYRLGILEKWKDRIYYRYSCCDSAMDLADVMFFFMETYCPGARTVEHSGRYDRIFLKEIDGQRLTTT